MKIVGKRALPLPQPSPSGELLRFAAAVNDPVIALLPAGVSATPKGIYRFRTLEEKNQREAAWLAEAMAEANARRE